MIELKLTASHFEELLKKGLSLDLLFLIKLREGGEDISSTPKLENLERTGIRKGLFTETGDVTEEGKQLLAFLSSTDKAPKIPRKKKEPKPDVVDNFTQWWSTFPPTNSFKYKGKQFEGDRAMRVKKSDCKVKLEKIIASGEYTIEELIAALKLEINQKMESSIKSSQNKLSYMHNSLTYLNQCDYEPFIELVRAGHKPKEETKIVSNETFI